MGADRTPPKHRPVTVAEAARVLNTSAEAIRSRIKRGTLPSIKEGTTVYVLLDTDQAPLEQQPDTAQTDALVAELRDQVRFLREELARKDAILLRMAESIPQLEAPSEPSEAPVTATEERERGEPHTRTEGPEEGAESRSWWRRIFGE